MIDIDPSAEAPIRFEKRESPGSGLLNFFLVKRRPERGDLVGSIALWSFLSILTCVLFGGSELKTDILHIVIPTVDWTIVTGLLTPIIAHTLKGAVESFHDK